MTQALAPPAGEIHAPGWRQELSAERVQCLVATPDGGRHLLTETSASDFPLAEPLTTAKLVDECARGNDAARSSASLQTDHTSVCVTGSAGGTATVVLGGSCGTMKALTGADLARLNRLRTVEVSLLAVRSGTECPTLDEASRWASKVIATSGVEATVTSLDEGPRACYRPVAYWDRNQVLVQALGPQPE